MCVCIRTFALCDDKKQTFGNAEDSRRLLVRAAATFFSLVGGRSVSS